MNTRMQKKYLGALLIFTGLFVTTLACLKEGYSPDSPLFANFLLGLGVGVQGVTYLLQGKDGSSGNAPKRKPLSLVFVIYYIAVVAFMLSRR